MEEAITFFATRKEYDRKRDTLILKVNNATAANLLKPLIAYHSKKEDKQLSEVLRAFRRHVTFQSDGQPRADKHPHSDAQSQLHRFPGEDAASLKDSEATSEWVKEHWEELRILERKGIRSDKEGKV